MGLCVCICAIDNNYSKDPMIKTTIRISNLYFILRHFLQIYTALFSWAYWAHSKCGHRLHNPHCTYQIKQLKENYNETHCMVLCTQIFESINNTKHMYYVILYLFNHALICIFFGKGARHTEVLCIP